MLVGASLLCAPSMWREDRLAIRSVAMAQIDVSSPNLAPAAAPGISGFHATAKSRSSASTMGRLEALLLRAAAEANHSELKNKHGALLVRSGKVIGSGCNSSRSRLSQMPGDVNAVSLHSEVAALHASGMCLLRA